MFDRCKDINHFNLEKLGWVAGIKRFIHGEQDCYVFKDKYLFFGQKLDDKYFYITDGEDMPEGQTFFDGELNNIKELKFIMKSLKLIK